MNINAESGSTIDVLYGAAIEADRSLRTRKEIEGILRDPNSRPVSRVHDWRNHLSEVVTNNWDVLPIEARLVAFISAVSAAHAEQWD